MNRDELRQAVLAAPEAKATVEPVPTPEWGPVNGHIFVRQLTVPERDRYLASIRTTILQAKSPQEERDARDIAGVVLVTIAMCDKDGEPLMSEEDVQVMAKKGWGAMQRIIDRAGDLNGLSKKSVDQAKNVSPSVATSV